jgi:hypothetical protein
VFGVLPADGTKPLCFRAKELFELWKLTVKQIGRDKSLLQTSSNNTPMPTIVKG